MNPDDIGAVIAQAKLEQSERVQALRDAAILTDAVAQRYQGMGYRDTGKVATRLARASVLIGEAVALMAGEDQ